MFSKSAAAVALAVSLVPAFALATQSKNFASCTGDHHGSYLKLWSITGADNVVSQVNIIRTDDSDNPGKVFQVKELSKDGVALPVKSYSWAIRQAIKAEAAGTWYGFIKIKAVNPNTGSVMFINLQKYNGTLRHALAIDGYIEELTCPLASVVD